jgi:hypothetical protein
MPPGESRKRPADLRGCGLWSAVVTDGAVNRAAWARAAAAGDIVGTCRRCGDYVTPDPPPAYGDEQPVEWFIVRCLACGHEAASPGGRLVTLSGHNPPPRTRQ